MGRKRNIKDIYDLDFSGTCLKKTTLEGASKFTGINTRLIRNALYKNTLVASKFYFSYKPEIVIIRGQNPLFCNIPELAEIRNDSIISERAWKQENKLSYEQKLEEKERVNRWNSIREQIAMNRETRAALLKYEKTEKKIENPDPEYEPVHILSYKLDRRLWHDEKFRKLWDGFDEKQKSLWTWVYS